MRAVLTAALRKVLCDPRLSAFPLATSCGASQTPQQPRQQRRPLRQRATRTFSSALCAPSPTAPDRPAWHAQRRGEVAVRTAAGRSSPARDPSPRQLSRIRNSAAPARRSKAAAKNRRATRVLLPAGSAAKRAAAFDGAHIRTPGAQVQDPRAGGNHIDACRPRNGGAHRDSASGWFSRDARNLQRHFRTAFTPSSGFRPACGGPSRNDIRRCPHPCAAS